MACTWDDGPVLHWSAPGSCSPAELTASGSVRETSSSGTIAKVVSCKPVNMDSAVSEVQGRKIGNKRAASDTSP